MDEPAGKNETKTGGTFLKTPLFTVRDIIFEKRSAAHERAPLPWCLQLCVAERSRTKLRDASVARRLCTGGGGGREGRESWSEGELEREGEEERKSCDSAHQPPNEQDGLHPLIPPSAHGLYSLFCAAFSSDRSSSPSRRASASLRRCCPSRSTTMVSIISDLDPLKSWNVLR